jgi:hypothetical protein
MLNSILDWSEVWAPLIPLYIFIFKRPKDNFLGIIAGYLLTAICINAVIDVSWLYNSRMPLILKNNNFLYNINSLCRIIFFTLLFRNPIKIFPKKYFDIFLFAYLLFYFFYLRYDDNFFTLNSLLHSTESICLLVFSIIYFIRLINSDKILLAFDPYLLIVSGLSIYESVNFFVFLFYQYLSANSKNFAHYLWDVHNVIFIIFCLLIAKAFYGRFKTTT